MAFQDRVRCQPCFCTLGICWHFLSSSSLGVMYGRLRCRRVRGVVRVSFSEFAFAPSLTLCFCFMQFVRPSRDGILFLVTSLVWCPWCVRTSTVFSLLQASAPLRCPSRRLSGTTGRARGTRGVPDFDSRLCLYLVPWSGGSCFGSCSAGSQRPRLARHLASRVQGSGSPQRPPNDMRSPRGGGAWSPMEPPTSRPPRSSTSLGATSRGSPTWRAPTCSTRAAHRRSRRVRRG